VCNIVISLHFVNLFKNILEYRCPVAYGFKEVENTCYAVIDWNVALKKTHDDALEFCSFFGFGLMYLEDESQRDSLQLVLQAKNEASSFWIQGSFNNSKFNTKLEF